MSNNSQITSEDYVAVVENFSNLGEAEQNQVKTALRNYLDTLKNEDVINLWNEYVGRFDNYLPYIYENDEDFFQMFFADRLEEMAQAICQGDYKCSDPYVWQDEVYNAVNSAEYLQNMPIKFDDLTDGILSNQEDFEDTINDFIVYLENYEVVFNCVYDNTVHHKTDGELTEECLAEINKICGTNLQFDGSQIYENRGDSAHYSNPLFPVFTSYTPREALKAARNVLRVVTQIQNGQITINK